MKARGAVVAAILGIMLMSALYPLRQYASQDSSVRALAGQERALSRRIADLRRQQDILLSDDEIERIAREELGMVRRGEVAFAVVPGAVRAPGASGKAAGPPTSPAPVRNAPRGWYDRWWDAVRSSLTGMR